MIVEIIQTLKAVNFFISQNCCIFVLLNLKNNNAMKKLFVISIFILMSVSGFNQKNWFTIMSEDFEGTFPSTGWSTYLKTIPGLPPNYQFQSYWGSTNYEAHTGTHSAWCAQSGPQPFPQPTSISFIDSWMLYGPFNLTDVGLSSAELNFWYDYDYIPITVNGYFVVRIGTDTSLWNPNANGKYPTDTINLPWTRSLGIYGNPVWVNKTINLSNYLGQTGIYIAFQFYEFDGMIDNGANVDDIILKKDINVGISENKTSNITVYPNPSNGNFTIDNITPGKPLDIYDMTGKVVYHTISFNTMNVNLNVSPGVYMLKSENISKKIIVN